MSLRVINTHEDLSRHHASKQSSNRSFGLVFAAVFLLLALVPLLHKRPIRLWAIVVCVLFAFTAFLWSSALGPLNRIWMRVGMAMNTVMSPVVTSALFFGVFTPAAVIRRWFDGDSLGLRYDPNRVTYWISHESTGSTPASMTRQF